MPLDENQVEQIVVPLGAPLVGRLLAYCVTALGTVGVTIIPAQDSAAKITAGIVAATFLLGNELYARWHAKQTAASAYTQGAASAGVTLAPSDVPPVVSGKAPAPVSAPAAPAPQSLKPTADASGNVSITPKGPAK